jgi:hypothetical protein
MSEFRRLKIKIGESEFEADVPEKQIGPMYAQFLAMLDRRSETPARSINLGTKAPTQEREMEAPVLAGPSVQFFNETFDRTLLSRIFDLSHDGAITLKVLPRGGDTIAEAMLLLLYGYYLLKNEECVLATQLFRAAKQSGVPLRRSINGYVKDRRFVNRGGRAKGSHYSLNGQGLEMAKVIAAKMFEQSGLSIAR